MNADASWASDLPVWKAAQPPRAEERPEGTAPLPPSRAGREPSPPRRPACGRARGRQDAFVNDQRTRGPQRAVTASRGPRAIHPRKGSRNPPSTDDVLPQSTDTTDPRRTDTYQCAPPNFCSGQDGQPHQVADAERIGARFYVGWRFPFYAFQLAVAQQ